MSEVNTTGVPLGDADHRGDSVFRKRTSNSQMVYDDGYYS